MSKDKFSTNSFAAFPAFAAVAEAGAAAQATAAQTMSDATSAFGTSFASSINDRWGPKPR